MRTDLSNDFLAEITERPETEEDGWEVPPYGIPGRILVQVINLDPLETIVHSYDSDTSVFWIPEGVGFEWWFHHYFDGEFPGEGWYVIEGVNGEYIRGDGWMTDDDEEWENGPVRLATAEEIAEETLGNPKDAA